MLYTEIAQNTQPNRSVKLPPTRHAHTAEAETLGRAAPFSCTLQNTQEPPVAYSDATNLLGGSGSI